MNTLAYTEDRLVEQHAPQLFTELLPHILSGQIELADLSPEALL